MKHIIIDAFNFRFIAGFTAIKSNDFERAFESVLTSMIRKLKAKFGYGKYYACWDAPYGAQFRKDINPNYKSNRQKVEDIDYITITSMKDLYEIYDIKNITLPKTEADDTIYVLSKELKTDDNEVIIVTRDHDLIQVVQAGYANDIYDPVKKQFMTIPSYSIVEYKSLVGDSSDHILGVRGIGEKKASKILSNYNGCMLDYLTESEYQQYTESKQIIDASLHPLLEENSKLIREILSN